VKQLALTNIKALKKAYGGSLSTTRANRASARPLSTKHSMHLVLRSSKAKGQWSFLKSKNDQIVRKLVDKFGKRYGVRIYSLANVGNHLHLQIRLTNRHTYNSFIRAITGAIALQITGRTRWAKGGAEKVKFWDYRPFTRIVTSLREILNLKDYIHVNALEGFGHTRSEARLLIEWAKRRPKLE
jgi:REP element-mobilizing transposase RayT